MQRYYGWQKNPAWSKPLLFLNGNNNNNNNNDSDCVSPVLQSPCIHYHRIYNMLALDGTTLEGFIRASSSGGHNDTYNIGEAMHSYCAHYGLNISKTFPSHANLVCNRMVGHDNKNGVVSTKQRKGAYSTALVLSAPDSGDNNGTKQGRLCLIDAPDQPFIFDNAFQQEQEQKQPDNEEKKQKKTKRKLLPVEERRAKQIDIDAIKEHRLVPLAILPLFLSFLPPCYSRVNTVLYECEMLESRVWNSFVDIGDHQAYLTEQVEALARNRRFMGFTYQCAYQSPQQRSLSQYERELHEAEVLQLRLQLQGLSQYGQERIKKAAAKSIKK